MGISIRLGYPEQWHNFAAGDVPADGELCFAVFETEGNKLSWIYGAYKAAQNEFYCDNGMGGEVLNGAFCRAWVPSSEIRVKERKDEAAQSAAAAQEAKAVEGAENPAVGAGAPQA